MTPEELMDKGKELLKSKREDYATGSQYENFERQAIITSWFRNEQDKIFTSMIAMKLARLATLLSTDTKPNHESIEDSFVDLINYCALWGGYHSSKK